MPKELMTCEWCYKWLGTWHRREDCPRPKPNNQSKQKEG